MNFNEYQEKSKKTAIYPNQGKNFIYPTLGLVGEAGEVAEKIKKVIRDNDGLLTEEKIQELKKELGDVLWYIAQMCIELNLTLDEVAEHNIEKLYSRMERGKLQGSGDER